MSQRDMDVRTATAADAPELARLRFVFRSEYRPSVESEQEFTERCEPWMRDRLARASQWRAWVAHEPEKSELVATLWLQLVEKLPNPGDEPEIHAYITSVYVAPELRNGGVGTRLVEAALTECRSLGVDTVFLWPNPRSRPLYARHGFAPPNDILTLIVRPPR